MDDRTDVIPLVGVYHKGSAFCQRMSQWWIPGNQGWYQAQHLFPPLFCLGSFHGSARMDTDTPILPLMHTQGKVWSHSHCWISVWFSGWNRRRLTGEDAGIFCTSINLRWISDIKCPAPNVLQYDWEQNIILKHEIYCCCLQEKTILCNFHHQWGCLRALKQTLWVAGCSSQVSDSSTK